MSWKVGELLAGAEVPHDNRLRGTTAKDEILALRERHARHRFKVSMKRANNLLIMHAPHADVHSASEHNLPIVARNVQCQYCSLQAE